jgi:hypothetical protein
VKREPTSTQGKPALDEETFQQLLAAANVLQQQNDSVLVKEPRADYVQTLSAGAIAENVGPIQVVPLTPETVANLVVPLEPQPKPAHLARLAHRYRTLGRRSFLTDELFWKAATVAAVAAVSALLLGATIYHFSPLPSGLAPSSEVVQQQVPFRRTKRIVTVPAQSGAVGTKTVVIEQPAATKTYGNEADVVAKDTVVRYGTYPAAPHLQAREKP